MSHGGQKEKQQIIEQTIHCNIKMQDTQVKPMYNWLIMLRKNQ